MSTDSSTRRLVDGRPVEPPPEDPELRAAVRRWRLVLRDMPQDEFETLAERALVALVQRGELGESHFVSPEAFRSFCSAHGIAVRQRDEELDELVADVSVRLLNGTAVLDELDEPSPLTSRCLHLISAAGGLRNVALTDLCAEELRRSRVAEAMVEMFPSIRARAAKRGLDASEAIEAIVACGAGRGDRLGEHPV